jgi:hypothetical protein
MIGARTPRIRELDVNHDVINSIIDADEDYIFTRVTRDEGVIEEAEIVDSTIFHNHKAGSKAFRVVPIDSEVTEEFSEAPSRRGSFGSLYDAASKVNTLFPKRGGKDLQKDCLPPLKPQTRFEHGISAQATHRLKIWFDKRYPDPGMDELELVSFVALVSNLAEADILDLFDLIDVDCLGFLQFDQLFLIYALVWALLTSNPYNPYNPNNPDNPNNPYNPNNPDKVLAHDSKQLGKYFSLYGESLFSLLATGQTPTPCLPALTLSLPIQNLSSSPPLPFFSLAAFSTSPPVSPSSNAHVRSIFSNDPLAAPSIFPHVAFSTSRISIAASIVTSTGILLFFHERFSYLVITPYELQ